jgi:hypothetical protein
MAEIAPSKKALKLAEELKKEGDVTLDKMSQSVTRARVNRLQEELHSERKKVVDEMSKSENMRKSVTALADHLEKMMRMLRLESQAKAKAIEQTRTQRKEISRLREALDLEKRKVGSHQALVAELHQGTRTLMDQLHLMDEKYLELRTKLDYARQVNEVEIVKAQKKANTLRAKFAMISKTHESLDLMKVPSGEVGSTVNKSGCSSNRGSSCMLSTFESGIQTHGSPTAENMNSHDAPSYHKVMRSPSDGCRSNASSTSQHSSRFAVASGMASSSKLSLGNVGNVSSYHVETSPSNLRVSFSPRPSSAPQTPKWSARKMRQEVLSPDQQFQLENRRAMEAIEKKMVDKGKGKSRPTSAAYRVGE